MVTRDNNQDAHMEDYVPRNGSWAAMYNACNPK